MKKNHLLNAVLLGMAACSFAGTSTANAATIIMDSSTLNGSFETNTLWVNSFAEPNTGSHQYETNWSSEGVRSIRIRANNASSGTGSAQNTGFVVSGTDSFDLSFDWNARAGWTADDAIVYTLFTTSDNTSAGTITTIAQGSVSGFPSNTAVTIPASFTGIGTVAGASVGQQLWIEFAYDLSSYSGSGDRNGRLDNVVLSVVPEPGSLALMALGGMCLMRRRRN